VESRVISTPWSRIVRGIGLGQHPIGYDQAAAGRIRESFAMLEQRVSQDDHYTRFSHALCELILQITDSSTTPNDYEIDGLIIAAADEARTVTNPYYRVTAWCILLSAVAKLGIDTSYTVSPSRDLPAEIIAAVDQVEPNKIKDENRGRHGEYERVAAWTAVFLAFGQLDLGGRLVSHSRDCVAEALASIDNIPAPFFRGRGGSMLMSAVALLGFDDHLFDRPHDYVASTLSWMDNVDELGIYPSFPSPMSTEFMKVYPLLTMLNAIAVTGRHDYLMFGRNRLQEAAHLMAAISPVERTHMGLYYVIALYNLHRLPTELPSLDDYVEPLINQWRGIDPGQDYFLNGISYAYLTQLAFFTGRDDLITEAMIERMLTAFPALEHTAENRANRPYPFSYVLNVLTELGLGELLYLPHDAYGGLSPFAWITEHLSPGAHAESARLYMIDHALISWALRQRAPGLNEPGALGRFTFTRAARR
jgi:hypothetical protein